MSPQKSNRLDIYGKGGTITVAKMNLVLQEDMTLDREIQEFLAIRGADFVHFVDLAGVAKEIRGAFPAAVLFGSALSPEYLEKVCRTPDYVKMIVRNHLVEQDEFHRKEQAMDRLADTLARFLSSKGFAAHSQSETNLALTGRYDERRKSSTLPHKTIALLAGMGWIGRNNLLITPDYGCALSMCTVLTAAPVSGKAHVPSSSRCGECTVCRDVCTPRALLGKSWEKGLPRDDLIKTENCTTCLKCLVHCPWTERFLKRG